MSYRSFLILFLVFPSSLWAQDTTPPTVSSATVDETTLVVNFNEGLASVSGLTNSAFTVKKTSSGGSEEDQTLIGTPTVRGETVPPTLSSAVIAPDMETVKVSYTAPTESGAKLRDAEGSDVVDSMDLKVLNICSRSEVVRDAILAQITETVSCGEVTSDDLRTITVLDLSQRGITELKSDDFNGLTGLQTLDLGTNSLTSLPQDLFDGLTNLRNLNLDGNSLTDLPQDLFDGLTSLSALWLDNNSLTDLHQDLFEELENLNILWLNNNALTDLHEDLFDGLTNLRNLNLDGNALTDLHQDLFDGLTNLGSIALQFNALTDLPRDLFDGLTSLQNLWLNNNSLTDLYEDLFDGLTGLSSLFITDNEFTGLHEELFDGLTNLERINFSRNDLTDLHEELFDGLTNLEVLRLDDNSLTSLHEDLFDGLTNLERISLSRNSLTDLHEELFDGLTNLREIDLGRNSLTSLHQDLFNGLTSLERIILSRNSLTDLPEDLFDGFISLSLLSLHNNALTDLPEDLFDGLISLSLLSLQNNALMGLHPNLFDDVEANPFNVSVEGNPLTCVPSRILNQENVIIIPSSLLVTCPNPSVTSATVDGITVEVNFNEDLASVSGLTNSAFTVKKTPDGGSETEQMLTGTPTVSGKTVTLTLSNPVIASDMGTVKVSYMAPTEPDAKLRDAEGHAVVNFTDLKVLNLRGGICPRTEVVRDAILNQITGTEFCYEVTSDDLGNVRSLNTLNNKGITELKSGDFNGLINLLILNLGTNSFTGLPEDLFDGLTKLTLLNLAGNNLTSLPEDLFAGLTSLSRLLISNNELTDLHEDLFDGLTSLARLTLHDNALTGLPEDLFDGLNNLATLNLDGNALTGLPENLFDGLTSLQFLILAGNNLTSLHPDLFDDVEANPFTVSLEENELTCVPAKILNQENVIINPASLRVACPDLSVTLSVNPSTIGEEDEATEVTVTATLEVSQTTALPVTVSVGSGTATSGTDFTAVSDFTISIPANTLSSTGTFTLTPTSDTVDEPDETVMITGTSTVKNVTVTGTSLTIIDDDTSTAAQAPTELPTVFTLHGNYPNPFNPSTRIQFDLPERAQVTVQVLDVLGRKVMEYPAQAFDAGANQTIELNAIQLGSGTYLYRMIAVGSETKYQETGRMILMK